MIKVSKEFKEEVYDKDNRNFLPYVDIVLRDGTVLNLTNHELWEAGFKLSDGTSSSGEFVIGAAIINKLTITINNINGHYSQYDFDDAIVSAYLSLKLKDRTEKIKKGIFKVDTANYDGAVITLECLDHMNELDIPYSESNLSYPASLLQIYLDACKRCEIKPGNSHFDYDDFVIQNRPEGDMTFREVISYIAQISGHYARCNADGALELKWYDFKAFKNEDGINGGIFDNYNSEIYGTGDFADGGNFQNYDPDFNIDGGIFKTMERYHHIYALNSLSVRTDDVMITGIKVEANSGSNQDKEEYLAGIDSYVITVSNNPFVETGKAQEIAEYLHAKIGGSVFRPLSVSALSDPSIEAGDAAYVSDRKGNSYQTVITNLEFSIGDYENFSCDAKTSGENKSKKYSSSEKTLNQARQAAQRQISAYDNNAQNFTNLISQSFGVFKTEQKLEDGSIVYYLHDKPVLQDSIEIWKMDSEEFSVSTDGGQTWSRGMDSEGKETVNILSAIGIELNWLKGGMLSLGGSNNRNGQLEVLGEDGLEACVMNKNGLKAVHADISGKIQMKDGNIHINSNMKNNYVIDLNAEDGKDQYRLCVSASSLLLLKENTQEKTFCSLNTDSGAAYGTYEGSIDNPTSFVNRVSVSDMADAYTGEVTVSTPQGNKKISIKNGLITHVL